MGARLWMLRCTAVSEALTLHVRMRGFLSGGSVEHTPCC